MSDDEETHYTGYGHDAATCDDCRTETKWSLARPLAAAIRDIGLDGTGALSTQRLVEALDAILDEWPR